jgi:hypothetical protein
LAAAERSVRVAGVDFSALAIERTRRAFAAFGVDTEIEIGYIDAYVRRH